MKTLNIFKKGDKKNIVSTTQKLDKKQLEKVIGGAETNTKGGTIPFVGGILASAAE